MPQEDVDVLLDALYILAFSLYDALLTAYAQAFLSVDRSTKAFQALVDIDRMRTSAYYAPHANA
jgi:hypothetical protein